MKKKIVSRKLHLSKKTISILNSGYNNFVAGGTNETMPPTSCACPPGSLLPTCPKTTATVKCPSAAETGCC